MKITDRTTELPSTLEDIEYGEVFKFKDRVCLKTGSDPVDLDTGETLDGGEILSDDIVIKVKSHLTIR